MTSKAPSEGRETPEALLLRITEAIRATEAADLDLLDILVEKIITLSPSENAVADATEEIAALAEKRAAEAGDAKPNQD